MKIYVVGNDVGVTQWLQSRKHEVTNINNPLETAEYLENPQLVVFTGGSDVWPALYGEKNTDSSVDKRRDITEAIWFHRFYNIPKLGICRGGQFLNVMSGGRMQQDINGHTLGGTHKVYVHNLGNIYNATSTHHQGMLEGRNASILAVEYTGIPAELEDGRTCREVLWYSYTKSLCFQPHPEYQVNEPGNDTITLLNYCIKKTVLAKDMLV